MINIKTSKLTPKDTSILDSAVTAALDYAGLKKPSSNIQWHYYILSADDGKTQYPVINANGATSDGLQFSALMETSMDGRNVTLEAVVIDADSLEEPVSYQISPLREVYILSNTQDTPQPREPHSQLKAYTELVNEIYSFTQDDELPTPPKVFLDKISFDYYMADFSITLQETILLWMESTGNLAVNMDDPAITTPRRLEGSIKRIYMHGPARNKLMVEYLDGTTKLFPLLAPSVQTELCEEILSIIQS